MVTALEKVLFSSFFRSGFPLRKSCDVTWRHLRNGRVVSWITHERILDFRSSHSLTFSCAVLERILVAAQGLPAC